jgi:hypothetical protein
MRRAVIALVTATALLLTGLTPGPLRATALGETSVTLNCTDGTSLTLLVGADTLAGLTAAVQAMIDYPAGLSCTLVQNPLPLTAFFGHVARAANPNTLIVAGGRWLAPCSLFRGGFETGIPGGTLARGGPRPGLAKIMPAPLASTPCPDLDPDPGCVWVNIGVNLHFTGSGVLQGTLNETIPENQFCPNVNNGQTSLGPSHFTSKPAPASCLKVLDKRAFTTTYVEHVFGPAFTTNALFPLEEDVHFSFLDNGNPSNAIDRLAGPPAAEESNCDLAGPSGTELPTYTLERGNINVYGPTTP